MTKKWYIIKAQSNSENKAAQNLQESISKQGLDLEVEKIIVPEEEISSLVNGKKKIVKKRIYPGYILIQMTISPKLSQLILNTKKITGFVGASNFSPTAISDTEAEKMIGLRDSKNKSHSFLKGDIVIIKNGGFSNFKGEIVEVEKDKAKLKVSIFGRSTDVEVSLSDIEKQLN